MVIASLIASPLGAKAGQKMSTKVLRVILAVLILATAAKIWIDIFKPSVKKLPCVIRKNESRCIIIMMIFLGVSFIGFKVRKNKRIFGALTWMIRM